MGIKTKVCNSKKIDNDLVGTHKIKITLTFNKPAYVGMCLLELSKVQMYEFHYDYIKKKYGNKSRLLFTDTDSLVYKIMKMFMKMLVKIKRCLILVIILLSQNITMIQMH